MTTVCDRCDEAGPDVAHRCFPVAYCGNAQGCGGWLCSRCNEQQPTEPLDAEHIASLRETWNGLAPARFR